MTNPVSIRLAVLDDTAAISELARAGIDVWQRLDANGRVQDLDYNALSVYERWLHGGAWMSLETSAIYLGHLLRGAGMPIVAASADSGQIIGYAEAYAGQEQAPFGRHVHIARLTSPADADGGIRRALIDEVVKRARAMGAQRITISVSSHDAETIGFYQSCDMQPLSQVGRYTLSAVTGQSFYRATEHPDASPAQIKGWQMSIGRQESARYHWETLWPPLWEIIPEIAQRRTHRLHVTASAQEAFVWCQQHLFDPRSADISCWSPKPMGSQLMTAIRDWTHREGYRNLVMFVPEATTRLFGDGVEAPPYHHLVYSRSID
jgi:ribosomal protein S18 acetylase RimI-like enzyme